MESTRDEERLRQIQGRIEMLYRDRGDDFNLPVRYQALVKLEGSLLNQLNAPNQRRERELAQLG